MAIYVRDGVSAAKQTINNDVKEFELLWIVVNYTHRPMIIGGLYHPPKPLYDIGLFFNFIESSVDDLLLKYPNALLVLAGDYNQLDIARLIERTGLTDLIHAPTRGSNCLDHVLVSNCCYDHVKIVKSVVNSDHSAIVAYSGSLLTNRSKTRTAHTFRKKSPAQHAATLQFLMTDGSSLFADIDAVSGDLQNSFNNFYGAMDYILNRFYPMRSVTLTSSDPTFITPEIKTALRRKNALMHKGKFEEANALAVKIGGLITRHNACQFKGLNPRSDSRTLWDQVKSVTSKRVHQTHPSHISAVILNEHYATISTDDKYEKSYTKHTAMANKELISEETLFHSLDKLHHTATGPDEIPAWLLRLIAPVISLPLSRLVNCSFSAGFVPAQWKSASIIPLPKVAHPAQAADYRPISLTSVISRVIERRFVNVFIYPAMSCPPPELRFLDQHAFKPMSSTTSALISILNTVSQMLTTQQFVRVFIFDFSKAFDRVRHCSLLSKISLFDIPDEAFNWLTNFLKDRSHSTKLEGVNSLRLPINASVVQGSAVGPSMFSVLASDLKPIHSDNAMIKFADDMYLIVPQSRSATCDAEVANIENWSNDNNLTLNRSKSLELIFVKPGCKPKVQLPSQIEGIPRVHRTKALGVTIRSDFSFSDHVSDTLSSSAKALFALRTLRSHGMHNYLLQKVFDSTVLTKLLYCSQVWWGFTNCEDKARLESFLNKSRRLEFCNPRHTSLAEMCASADTMLFNKVLNCSKHPLHHLLPPKIDHCYNLRPRAHNRTIPDKTTALLQRNFLNRMLYKDCY